jgi:hypothetical protein
MSKKSIKDSVLTEVPTGLSSEPDSSPLADSVDTSSLAPYLSSALSGLIAEYTRLEAEIAAYNAAPYLVDRLDTLSALKLQIEEICLSVPSKRILGAWGSTTRTAKSTSKLNQNKLMIESTKRGYDPIEVKAIIDLSTDKIKGKEYVLINIGKDGK